MKKSLIFGAGGFVGPYLTKELHEHGYEVFGSDIMKPAKAGMYEDFIECNLLNADSVKETIDKVKPNSIINLAAISSVGLSWKMPSKTMGVNVCGGLNIIEAVRDIELDSTILFIGSSEEYKISEKPISESNPIDANNPYGISKATMERLSSIYNEKYGMHIKHVRAFNHTGIGQKDTFVLPSWCKQVASIAASGLSGTVKVGNVSVSRDFSDVRDIVRGYRLVLEADENKVYNVGSGKAYPLSELLDNIISLSPVQINVEIDQNLLRKADNPVICCDNSKIKKELGWQPEHEIFDTLKEMYEYYFETFSK